MSRTPPVGGPPPTYPSGEGKKPDLNPEMLKTIANVTELGGKTFLNPEIADEPKVSTKVHTASNEPPKGADLKKEQSAARNLGS